MGWIIIAILFIILFVLVISNIAVVQQSRAYVIERLGAFQTVWGVGLHFKIPFIDRIARRVSLKEQVLDYPPQPVITKDNVHADRYRCLLPDYRPQAVCLRCGAAYGCHGDPHRHHPA